MASFAFPPPDPVGLAIDGTDVVFPVHRIFCVGRNYAAHAREMGADPEREPPFFFTKPADAIVPSGATIPYPTVTADLHHEIELVVALGRGGRSIAAGDAREHVFGYAVGIDLTRRDLQAEAKRSGRPWDAAKAFDRSAPCSAIRTAAAIGHPGRGRIWLDVAGERRQDGDLANMLWPVPDVIDRLSRLFELCSGDLVFTGTPAGVGPLRAGDRLEGGIDGVGAIELAIA